MIPLLAYQSTFTNTRTCCSPSQNFLHFTLQRCDFPDFWAIPFDTRKDEKVIFFTKGKINSKYVTIHLLAYQRPFINTRTCCSPSQKFLYFTLQRCDFPDFWAIPFDTKVIFSQKKRWIRTSVTIHLLAYQSTFKNTGTSCSPSQNFLNFSLQKCDFPDFLAIPFDIKVIFFTKEKINSKICHDTLVGIPASLHKHQDVLLSIAELPIFYIAKVRFSRFLSHPFWCKSHFFHKRKDEFEHLSRYTCWHTRVPSQTPGRVASHRRTSYILHCKIAIFPIFEPSLLIQKSFFSQKKRWIRKSVMIHLLAYQSTFINTGTSCSPPQNFLHFILQRCDFHDFWAIPFDTKVIFSQKKRWIRKSVTIHLLAYQSTFTNTRTSCSPSQNFLHFTLQRCDFPDFWAIPFDTKVIFFTKEKMNSKICHHTLVGIPEYLHKHQDVLLSIAELPTFYIAKMRFSWFLSHPFWYKSHFFHKRKDEFEHLSRYTCWHTRVPSKTPGRLALHRRTSYILHCKCAIFPIFEPSLLTQKSFFSQKNRLIRTSVTIHLLAYQSTFINTRTCCSPSENFLHFTWQRCDFPDFWAIPFDTKVIFFTKEKMNLNICHDTLVGIPEYLQKHPGRLALHPRTSYILHCKCAIFPIFEPSLLIQKSFFSQKKRWIRTSVTIHLLAYQSTFKNTQGSPAPHRRTSYSRFLSHPFWYKSHFFHKWKDEFENLSWYTCWHIAELPTNFLHFTLQILYCKCAIFPIFEPSLLIQKSFFSQKKRWIRTSVTIHLLAYQSTFINTRTSCSPSQNFLHFTLQRCDFPDFWAIPFDTKVIFFTKEKMNSNICHDTLVGIPEYLQNTRTSCSPSQNFLHFTLQMCDFPDFWAIPFDTKVIFFTKEKMNSNICHDTPVGIPEYLHKHQDVLLSIGELPTFHMAKVRFSGFLSHPFWYKSHLFHKRKDDFEHLSRYTCWYTRVPSKTPWRLALHPRTSYILHCKCAIFAIFEPSLLIQKSFFSQKKRWIRTSVTIHLLAYQSTFKNTGTSPAPHRRTSYILHCKGAIFPIFEPSLLIQKSFFSQKKRWIRKSVTIHLLAYQSTFKNTRTCCSPSQNFLHFTLQSAIFPIFEPSLLIQKSFFSQKKRWIRKSVTIHLLAYQRPFINTRTCCSPSQNFLYFTLQRCDFPDFWAIPFDTKVIFSQKKRWIRTSVTIHLLAYQSTFKNTRTSCSPSQNFLHFTLQMCDFPDFWAIPFDTKVIFFTKEKINSKICHDTLVGIPASLHKHQDVLLSIAELPIFYIAKVRFSRFLSHPFWCKSHFFHKRKDEFEHLSRYTCWHTRVPSQTPGRVASHRRTSYILHCKIAIFPIFEPSLLIQKSFFSQKKRWIRKSVIIHLLAYQSTFINTGTSCSPPQNFLHFTLQMCDFPDFWAIPFDRKVIFFTKEKMNSNICHDTLVGIPEYLQKHQEVLLSIAELPTFYIANVRFSRFLSPFWYKSHFFHKRKDEFENLSWYTCWHTRVPS